MIKMILIASTLIGIGYLLAIQAREEYRRATHWTVQLNHASKIFPHENEKTRPWQRRK
jgi:hypothetical protein